MSARTTAARLHTGSRILITRPGGERLPVRLTVTPLADGTIRAAYQHETRRIDGVIIFLPADRVSLA